MLLRVVLTRPPDAEVLSRVESALRGSDSVMTCPGFEIEFSLSDTTPQAAVEVVMPRLLEAVERQIVRCIQINGEDVVREDF